MEDNILIAEFMGFDPITEKYFEDNGFENEKQMIIDTSSCKYSTSWDWLMPVVEKIEKEGFKSTIENQWAGFDGCTDENDGLWIDSKTPCNTKLEATYKAVVEFIQWYNNNKN
jgi:hypothetical protein